MKQENGRTRGLALGLLAALMVMGLSDTAMAKSWRGGPTDKWHEKHWGYHQVFPSETTPPENPPTEEELAVIGYYQKTPVVNVENQDAVASVLSFSSYNNSDLDATVNIKNGGRLTLGAPGKVARIV